MREMKTFVIATLIITVVIAVALVLRYRWFLKKLREEEFERKKAFKPMLSENAPYVKYKKISSIRSVKSVAIRREGDFLDFILGHSAGNKNSDKIESNLANASVGEDEL